MFHMVLVSREFAADFWIQNVTATSNSMPNPRQHIKGAVTLINLRGSQNFASDTAKKLFSFVKVTLVSPK